MGRPIYPHEVSDPDFAWLISNFQDSNPQYVLVELTSLPLVFVKDDRTPESRQAEIVVRDAGEEEGVKTR